jgi:hypothetical protein
MYDSNIIFSKLYTISRSLFQHKVGVAVKHQLDDSVAPRAENISNREQIELKIPN